MDRSLPAPSRAAPRIRGGLSAVTAVVAILAAGAARADGLEPLAGTHYVNSALAFTVELPRGHAACHLPPERWREGVVLLPGPGASCSALRSLAAMVAVSGEPNTEAFGDVDSVAASVCADSVGAAVPIHAARRSIAGLRTLTCMHQEESGTVAIEVLAQHATDKPPATWTNLRVTLHVRGDRWVEFTRLLDDVVDRIGLLPPRSSFGRPRGP